MMRLLGFVFLAGTAVFLIWSYSSERVRRIAPGQSHADAALPKDSGERRSAVVVVSEPTKSAATTVGGLVAALTVELRDGSSSKRDHALHELLPRLVNSDEKAAAQIALGWESGALREELLRQVVDAWLAKDTRGALTWIDSLAEPADRQLATVTAIRFLGKSDPAGALELALATGIGTRDGSTDHIAQIWAEEKPAEAEAWVVARSPGLERDQLLTRIASVHAQRNPSEAATLVLTQMSPGPIRDEALLEVVRRWAALDPTGASRWVAQFPPGSLFDRAVAELATFSK